MAEWNPFESLSANVEPPTPDQMRWLQTQTRSVQIGKFQTEESVLRDLQFNTDSWTRYLWEKSRDRTPGINDAIVSGVKQTATFEGFGREVFGRLHNSEQLVELESPDPSDEWAKKLHGIMEDMPEFGNFRTRTVGDPLWAGMGSAALMESLMDALADANAGEEKLPDVSKLRKQLDAAKRIQAAAGGIGVDDEVDNMLKNIEGQIANAEASGQKISSNLENSESSLRQRIREGMVNAQARIEEMQDCMNSASIGNGAGSEGKGIGIDAQLELARLIRESSRFKRIAKIAGRMRAIASDKRKTRSDQARTELHSIETGNEPLQVLPTETALLLNPATRLYFYSKYSSESLLQYRLQGKERKARGPVILCIDVSGSMEGQRELWSKAIFIAMLECCMKDKRDLLLYYFDDGVRASYTFSHKTPATPEELITACEYFSGGGTSLEEVLNGACRDVEHGASTGLDRADIVVVTDGAVNVSESLQQRVATAQRKTGLTVIGIVIAGDSNPLEKLNARIERVNGLAEESKGFDPNASVHAAMKAKDAGALDTVFLL